MADDDTIAAIITPPGEGGLGAIRISGPKSDLIIKKIFRPAPSETTPNRHFHLYYGHIIDRDNEIIDEVTVVTMPAGKSFTGGKQAEIFCHGGSYTLKKILADIYSRGARPAEPGEFTRRAFLSGRIDLARAEAVADLIAANTEYSYNSAKNQLLGSLSEKVDKIRRRAIRIMAEIEAAVDYPEEDITAESGQICEDMTKLKADLKELVDSYGSGRIIRDGFRVAIAGRPNAGKSSLFNLFLNQNRAIVSPTAGTTRDYISEWLDLDGIAVLLTDTAGLRVGQRIGKIEKAGQQSALRSLKEADLIIWIVDIAKKDYEAELKKDLDRYSKEGEILLAFNKIDKLTAKRKKLPIKSGTIAISCKTRAGYKSLKKALLKRIIGDMPDMTERLVVTSARHKEKLSGALKAIRRADRSLKKNESPELVAFEMRQAVNEIDELTGKIYNEDILEEIFSRFCIGK